VLNPTSRDQRVRAGMRTDIPPATHSEPLADPLSAEEAGHENEDGGQQESDPEKQPQEVITAHDGLPLQSANENTPLSDVPATGTE
jgi:hypothetical protein